MEHDVNKASFGHEGPIRVEAPIIDHLRDFGPSLETYKVV